MSLARKSVRAAALGLVGLLACPRAEAGSAGSAGADFLNFGQGPRGIAMGESQAAAAEDAYAAYWNPAGLSLLEHPQAALSYDRSFEGVNTQYFSLAWPLRRGSCVDANFTRLGTGSFDAFDAQGTRTGSTSAGDYALGAAYGRTVLADDRGRPVMSLGANVKGIRETLAGVGAGTWATDLGAMVHWRPGSGGPPGAAAERAGSSPGALAAEAWGDRELRLGLSLQNLGPGLKFDRQSAPLPAAYRLGLAWVTHPKGDRFTVSLDQVVAKDQPYYAAVGGEYLAWRTVAFRLGYRTGQDIGLGIRAGVGLKLKVVDVDYAFSAFGSLGEMHRLGLTMKLGGPVEITPPAESALEALFVRAARLMSEGRYSEAILQYDKVLGVDPGNKRALEGMRNAAAAMRDSKPVVAP